VEEIKFTAQSEKILEVLQKGKLETYSKRIEKMMEGGEYVSMDIAAALLKMMTSVPEIPAQEKPAYEDRGYNDRGRRGHDDRGRGSDRRGDRNRNGQREYGSRNSVLQREEPGMARLCLNAGKSDGIRPGDVVGAIAGEADIPGNVIGVITIQDTQTFVDIPEELANQVMHDLRGKSVRGKRVFNISSASSSTIIFTSLKETVFRSM
jgi:ATP-dependent RNA helicase DeaD